MYASVSGGGAGGIDGGLALEWPEVAARRRRATLKYHLLALLLFVVVDLPWLLLNAESVGNMIQQIQGSPLVFRAWAAVPVYVALAYLAAKPNSSQEAFLIGLCVYAVYDFTNLSTLDDWSWRFALADSLWGGVITSIVFTILTRPKVARWLE